MPYRFGPFTADRASYRVLKGDQPLDLTPKLLDLLFYLLDRPAVLVTKEELLDGVWPGANVTDNALAQAISELRDGLGDRASAPTYIRTIARRGYRFIAPVNTDSSDSTPGGRASQDSSGSSATRMFDEANRHGGADGTGAAGDAGAIAGRAGNDAAPGQAPASGGNSADASRTATTTGASIDGVAPRAHGRRAIAVRDFQNVSGDATIAWLSAGIAETVTSDLAGLDHFTVVDRWRVALAERRGGVPVSLHELGGALGASLLVVGSYQRHGPRLRITARIVDVANGDALADAKVDGGLDEVFDLQDGIVQSFARELCLPARAAGRLGVRETASLDAYRAFTEGLVRMESLDTDLVRGSIADFERAIRFDSAYAMAYTGLANAQFVAYEMTRATRAPDAAALASGIRHARRALELDNHLAEAYATLSFLLVSAGAFDEARAAAQRAVALEPDSWRHQYRLGHALWGTPRLRALDRAQALYPQFPYASFEAAMVHVARGHLDAAERITRRRIDDQERQPAAARFPGVGFHWLLGAIEAAGGRFDAALAAFDREIAHLDSRRLYGPEYAAWAFIGRGHALLRRARPHEALAAFESAFDHVDGHPHACVGEALALEQLGRVEPAADAWQRVRRIEADPVASGRQPDALLFSAIAAAAQGDLETAVGRLDTLVDRFPPCHLGWSLRIEPVLAPVIDHRGIDGVLGRVAERAR